MRREQLGSGAPPWASGAFPGANPEPGAPGPGPANAVPRRGTPPAINLPISRSLILLRIDFHRAPTSP